MRGIKLHSFKEKTRDEKIGSMPIPSRVTLYASQHIGAPSSVTVGKGDEVGRGGLVARASGSCSVNLHSPVAGKVADIGEADRPCGSLSQAVVIETSGASQDIELLPPLKKLTPENLRERALEAGLEGLGGLGIGRVAEQAHAQFGLLKRALALAATPEAAQLEAPVARELRIVVAGANDGQLHAFRTSDGAEVWSFIPPNFLHKLKNIAHKVHPTGLSHQYFVDGPVSVAAV